MSSTQVATCGNSSLTSAPDCPYFWNANGEPSTLSLILKTVVGGLNGSGWPLSLLQPRLRIERVHLRRAAIHEQEDHRLRFRPRNAAHCGASGFWVDGSPPFPPTARPAPGRRIRWRSGKHILRVNDLPHINKLRRIKKHVRQIRPGECDRCVADKIQSGLQAPTRSGSAAERRLHTSRSPAAPDRSVCRRQRAAPTLAIPAQEFVVHQNQRLRGHGGDAAPPDGRDRQRIIEARNIGVKKLRRT